MSEIEKMYENAGIKSFKTCEFCTQKSIDCLKENISNKACGYASDMYPPFTSEKQLLLLQWLLDKTDLYLHKHKTDYTYSIATGDIAVNKYKCFKESIAEFVNKIWQDLTEEEKQQVKGILE